MKKLLNVIRTLNDYAPGDYQHLTITLHGDRSGQIMVRHCSECSHIELYSFTDYRKLDLKAVEEIVVDKLTKLPLAMG